MSLVPPEFLKTLDGRRPGRFSPLLGAKDPVLGFEGIAPDGHGCILG